MSVSVASIVQVVLYSIGLLLAAIEVGLCARAVSLFATYDTEREYDFIWMWSIGGIVHGVVLCLYFMAFLAMHRRNSILVRTTTDLILGFLFFASCMLSGFFFALIAFAPGAPLLLNFIVEAIVVGRSKVPGKWKLSLYNVGEGGNPAPTYGYDMQNRGMTHAPAPMGSGQHAS